MTARPQFGRRISPPTDAQRSARADACWLFGVFASAMTLALQVTRPGLAVLLVVLAFVSLFAGMTAASEA